MKKLFVSVPMKNRTKENIKHSIECMHKIAEIAFGEELELINSYIKDFSPTSSKMAVWCLGKSIELLAQADYFIGIENYNFPGCHLERMAAEFYGIKRFMLNPYQCTFFNDVMENLEDFNRQIKSQL